MIYSYTEVSNKLNELLNYSKNKYGSQFYSQFESQIARVKSAMKAYLSLNKNTIAKKLEEFIHSYLWYNSCKDQKCENDDYLGISVPELQTFYFINDFRLLTTNDCFSFETIINTSNEDFSSAWHVTSSSGSGGAQIAVNEYIGYDGVIGWVDKIAQKREIEIKNIKQAISDMEDNAFEIPDVIETFEDRGSPINDFNIIADSSPKNYKVLVKTIDGEKYENRYGSNTEYQIDQSYTVEGLANIIYLPEYKGMFDIIRCLELYNINDFSSNSKPCSTFGSNKVYIPSYLKATFKKLIG